MNLSSTCKRLHRAGDHHLATNEGLHGLPDKYLMNYVKNVFAVIPEEVRKMTQKYLSADDTTLTIVGNKEKVEEQIKDYASPKPEAT